MRLFAAMWRDYRADKLAHELPGSARPVGSIVELKRHRPALYIERNVTLNLNADVNSAPPPGVEEQMARFRAMQSAPLALPQIVIDMETSPGLPEPPAA